MIDDKAYNRLYKDLIKSLESELKEQLIECDKIVPETSNPHYETVNSMKLIYKQKVEYLQMLIRKHHKKVEDLNKI